MITKKQINVAINFLFPTVTETSRTYKKIEHFIREEYLRLGTSVLWYRNKNFMNLLDSCRLSIGEKEVIVTAKGVKASNSFTKFPCLIFGA